jgi:hypothetical protein
LTLCALYRLIGIEMGEFMTLSRKCLVTTFAFAAATVVFTVLFGTPPVPVAPMADGFTTPMFALEFARSVGDLAFLQGQAADGLRSHLQRTQELDRFFPIAYAGMAAVFFCGLLARHRGLASIGVVLAVLTIPADWLENRYVDSVISISNPHVCISISDREGEMMCAELDMAPPFPTGTIDGAVDSDVVTSRLADVLQGLQTTTWIKWGLIALYAALMSILMFQDRRRILAIPGAVAALAILATYLSGSNGHVAEIMGITLLPFMLSFPIAAIFYLRAPERTP